jgi:membrane protein
MANIGPLLNKTGEFLKTEIWRINLADIGFIRSFFIKLIRVMLLLIRGFYEDKLPLRASALTFYSILSLVPVLAMAFGIAKGFGFQKILENRLLENFPGQEKLLTQLIEIARTMLETTKGGLIAGIGTAVLFWTAIQVLDNIESAFNDIWGIKSYRTFRRKFSDYLAMMLIGPLLLIMSGSVTVFITTQITTIMSKISLLGLVSPLIFFMLKLLPYFLVWILFTVIYILMPNTKVRVRSGLIAGIAAGTAYHLAQWIYIYFQIGVARYNAIYGSFAALPLFIIWLQISWLIVLLGAEISFSHQNADTFEYEPDIVNISVFNKRLITLYIAQNIIRNFAQGKKPLTAFQISQEYGIPIRLVRPILQELVESHTFSITQTEDNNEPAYQPASDINRFTIQYLIDALEKGGTSDFPIKRTEGLDALFKALDSLNLLLKKAPDNKLLKDI